MTSAPRPTLNQDILFAVGPALYGPRWQSELARDLSVSVRTMQRWVAGEGPIPDGVMIDLQRLVQARSEDVSQLLDRFRASGLVTTYDGDGT